MRLRLVSTVSRQLQRHRWFATSATQHGHEQHNNNNNNKEQGETRGKRFNNGIVYGAATIGGIAAGILLFNELDKQRNPSSSSSPVVVHAQADADEETKARLWHSTKREDLPTYSADDVGKHNNPEAGIWITYGVGVYDVTEFAPNHPGGDKIMMAAGSAIDPFWSIFQQHNTLEVLELLEGFRIGNLNRSDVAVVDEKDSPWSQEPKRHALLKPASERPFNAEPPIGLLPDHFLTPNELFYVRNHLPVPTLQPDEYELELEVESGDGKPQHKLTLEEIKALPKHSVTAAIMCGGNRRSEMTRVKPVKGLSWGAGAVGNAKWSGARLCDVLQAMGVQPSEKLHVIFEGADLDPTSHPYGASIPLSKAMDPRGDVLLAYEMNNEPLSRDHGYPIRVIVPGTVGARNVKWLTRIIVADHESDSHWQQNDYKGFSPSTDWDTVDFSKSLAIQSMPVTSAICTPMPEEHVKVDEEGCITARGYAWSGGGRRIVRVDLTSDGGKTWHVAELEQEDLPDGRHYGWSLWTARLPITSDQKNAQHIEIWAKAVDSAYNVQPEAFEHIWNLRGVLANAYHKVKVKLI
ncbi:probable sulfite oxidase, mitochondrial [Drosophila innubila]|uniref:probable sulfite oxidase, mitochondrial n=1 Tax=Drosophila innubila TaxID=198719 RepID=UPI00148BA537|nr:probable sulfite oxidase, mitochondrial [Drosophila innubila]XP_034476359.1 probable sulfite oxidase, mitochondrial [Drosophila innubila]